MYFFGRSFFFFLFFFLLWIPLCPDFFFCVKRFSIGTRDVFSSLVDSDVFEKRYSTMQDMTLLPLPLQRRSPFRGVLYFSLRTVQILPFTLPVVRMELVVFTVMWMFSRRFEPNHSLDFTRPHAPRMTPTGALVEFFCGRSAQW